MRPKIYVWLAATLAFLLGLMLIGLPWGFLDLRPKSPDRILHASLLTCTLWLGGRGMWSNRSLSGLLALTGFVCGVFALIGFVYRIAHPTMSCCAHRGASYRTSFEPSRPRPRPPRLGELGPEKPKLAPAALERTGGLGPGANAADATARTIPH